eukprot:1650786-Pleurochrysis_carterae.AAC.1
MGMQFAGMRACTCMRALTRLARFMQVRMNARLVHAASANQASQLRSHAHHVTQSKNCRTAHRVARTSTCTHAHAVHARANLQHTCEQACDS